MAGFGIVDRFLHNYNAQQLRRRQQIEDALRLWKEERTEEERMIKSQRDYETSKIEEEEVSKELEALHKQRESIETSPDKPAKRDASLEGRIIDAQERLAEARESVQSNQNKLMQLAEQRDAAVEKMLPRRTEGGFFGFGGTEISKEQQEKENARLPIAEQQKLEAERAEKMGEWLQGSEGTEYRKSVEGYEDEALPAQDKARREESTIGSLEKQQQIVEEAQRIDNAREKRDKLYGLEKDEDALNIRRRQAEIDRQTAETEYGIASQAQQLAPLMYPQRHHGGILGALFGKDGGMGGLASGGGMMGGRTIGQAIAPMMNMPVAAMPHMFNAFRQGVAGGGRQRQGGMMGGMPQMAPPGSQSPFAGPGQVGAMQGMPSTLQPAQGGGPVPITNSMYDPRSGQFTGQTGVDWYRQQQGQGQVPMPPPRPPGLDRDRLREAEKLRAPPGQFGYPRDSRGMNQGPSSSLTADDYKNAPTTPADWAGTRDDYIRAYKAKSGRMNPIRGSMGDMPSAGSGDQMAQYRDAIASIESRGSGDYNALNRRTGATGRYQVMPRNIAPWTREALGHPMSQQQFLRNPQAQDAVFNRVFGGYVDRYGPYGAANMWFTGRPNPRATARDVTGTTAPQYLRRFASAIQTPSGGQKTQIASKSQGIERVSDRGPGTHQGTYRGQSYSYDTEPALGREFFEGQDQGQQQQQQQQQGGGGETRPKPIQISAPDQRPDSQMPQMPQFQGQGAGQGQGTLPRIQSEDQIRSLRLKPGQGFIGPDGRVHFVPHPMPEMTEA